MQTLGPNYSEIEQAIADMLKENTGIHFLDSGGAYGRHWQRNQAIADFRDLPEIELDFWNDSVSVTLNVFHLLTSFLEIDETGKELQKKFDEYSELPDQKEESWLSVIESFNDAILKPEYNYHIGHSFNTYNEDSMLSQVLQGYVIYTDSDEYPEYIILQIHNGCDVRGGYTKPKIFKITDFDYFIIAQHDLDASCKCTDMYSDDCGYHWYVSNSPEKTELDKLLGTDMGQEIERYKFPNYWKIDSEEKRIKCLACKHDVNITASLDH